SRPRPFEQIFPMQQGDANRGREMQSAWRSFCRDRLEAVRGVLGVGRSPPEIAYQLGELLHNHFRTRGVTLTSYELRRLVAELLSLHDPADERHEPVPTLATPTLPAPPVPTSPPPVAAAPEPPTKKETPPKSLGAPRPRAAAPPAVVPVVAFEREPQQPWPGDVPQAPPPAVADTPLERLLSRAIDLAKGRAAAARPDSPVTAAEQAVSVPLPGIPSELSVAPPERPLAATVEKPAVVVASNEKPLAAAASNEKPAPPASP